MLLINNEACRTYQFRNENIFFYLKTYSNRHQSVSHYSHPDSLRPEYLSYIRYYLGLAFISPDPRRSRTAPVPIASTIYHTTARLPPLSHSYKRSNTGFLKINTKLTDGRILVGRRTFAEGCRKRLK